MNVKQSQLQPLLLFPIACGLIRHTHTHTQTRAGTKRRRKRSLCKACFTYRHQMWQQCRSRQKGRAASGATAVCGSYGTPFSLEGVQAETYQRQLETVTVTKSCCPGPEGTASVCECEWGLLCLVCPLTCHRLQYVYCI